MPEGQFKEYRKNLNFIWLTSGLFLVYPSIIGVRLLIEWLHQKGDCGYWKMLDTHKDVAAYAAALYQV